MPGSAGDRPFWQGWRLPFFNNDDEYEEEYETEYEAEPAQPEHSSPSGQEAAATPSMAQGGDMHAAPHAEAAGGAEAAPAATATVQASLGGDFRSSWAAQVV